MLSRLLLLVTLGLVAACDAGEDGAASEGGGGSTASSAAGGGSGGAGGIVAGGGGSGGVESGGSGGSGGAPGVPTVKGVLVDEAGQPVAGATVLCCSAKDCFFDDTSDQGGFFFAFATELPADYVLKSLEDPDATPRRAATMFPLRFTDTVPIDAGALLVPSLPAGALLGPEGADPQTLDVGDGLQLVVARADLVPPLGGSLYDIAARAIPPEQVPPLPELGAEVVVSVYALYPFATRSESPIGVSAPSDLPAGTPVKFRTLGELDGKLSAPAAGTADGVRVETAALSGIDDLTWLVISK
jgi:hypothetical protein